MLVVGHCPSHIENGSHRINRGTAILAAANLHRRFCWFSCRGVLVLFSQCPAAWRSQKRSEVVALGRRRLLCIARPCLYAAAPTTISTLGHTPRILTRYT